MRVTSPSSPARRMAWGGCANSHWRQYTNALRKAAVARRAEAVADVPVPEPEPDVADSAEAPEPETPPPPKARRAKAESEEQAATE